ncbi:hypothetical protein ROZALSC1DRAFT_31670 [Rozella allomycis CSF55]|uniref:Dynein heavy chain domain-containing protein n=1 Tax=Rozella allomycis (strain CSF55) TaxID=988480 RepID=A0A075AMH1_ROZAC|nr:Dynein heavy chain domain-containing protein [Rozella allomycis CSF55]RKP16370.1 hypothetical protein ROZALSC1DRAFT_31670 [Rozella allomycis CSF55]|eukprot:EPZ30806.1 Dynein heavy chain domain-containing protein [Rozella allomycis CSF55]
MLYSQGFKCAEILSKKIVPLFSLCKEQASVQNHYDFGLRALKNCLIRAGNIKREVKMGVVSEESRVVSEKLGSDIIELKILYSSMPKMVGSDVNLLEKLLNNLFPGIEYSVNQLDLLMKCIKTVSKKLYLIGPSGCGKSTCWQVLLKALEEYDKKESVSYVIDPKSVSKEELYGTLDQTTREWTDGLFTGILRRKLLIILEVK